jgi:hypothetical protein
MIFSRQMVSGNGLKNMDPKILLNNDNEKLSPRFLCRLTAFIKLL